MYQITDLCGNSATCSVVFYNDIIDPTIVCPPTIMTECDILSNAPFLSLMEFQAAGGVVTDNCQIDNASFTLISETTITLLVLK